MLTQNGSIGRVDYVRVMCRVAPGYEGKWVTDMMNCVPEEYKVDAAVFRKHGKIAPIYDGKSRRATKCFEVWGEVAGMVFANLPTAQYEHITRLDWRYEIPTPPLDIIPLLQEVQKIKTNSRRTFKYIDSPVRTKEDGRDAGGTSIIVGSKGSKRRLAIYKRAKAHWALEVQFGDGQPQEFVKHARAAAEHGTAHQDLYTNMITLMMQAHHDAVLDMTGHTYQEFAHLEFWNVQDSLFEGQESLLARADLLWNQLDPEAQAAFITANVAPNGRYGMPIETADEMIDAIAPSAYTDEQLDDMEAEYAQALDVSAYDEYTQGDW